MFPYTLTKKRGIKYVRLTIHPQGEVRVSAPFWVSLRRIELFLQQKSEWIEEKIHEVKKRVERSRSAQKISYGSYATHAKRAKKLIKERVDHYNTYYQFNYNRISIKKHETRWGSCSKKGNLNFNYKLFFLPLELVDYVVVHELCHLQELNHSKKFWALVSEQIPHHKHCRNELKKIVTL